jgi:hypothetical protein
MGFFDQPSEEEKQKNIAKALASTEEKVRKKAISKGFDVDGAIYVLEAYVPKEDETKTILGYRQYDDIKTNLDTGPAKEKELIKLIRYYIVESSIYEALPSMTVLIEDGSIFSISVSDMPNIGTNSSNNITMINTLRQQCKEKAAYYQNEIRNYLHIYKDDFTLWKEDCYIEDRPRSVFHSPDCVGGIMI